MRIYLVSLIAWILIGCATTPGRAHTAGSSFAPANTGIVEVAKDWVSTNTWDQKTKTFYLEGHPNPYLSRAGHPNYFWDYWCAAFVGEVIREANGTTDPDFEAAGPARDVPPGTRPYNPERDTPDKIGAKVAFALMKKHKRVRTDWDNITAGAAVFWTSGLPYGHVAIYTGDLDEAGEPLIITTGWPARPGTRTRSFKDLKQDLGSPSGWVAF